MLRFNYLPVVILLLAGWTSVAFADGMVVPVRPEQRVRGHWTVKYHHVDMVVRDQVATVTIDQAFEATGNQTIEVEYLFPVPPNAGIDSMTLLVDGKEFKAKLMKADEARSIYESIVRQKKDPALLEYAGFGLYKTSAFPLNPGKPVKVVVTYKNVCKKDARLVEVWYPLNTEKYSAKAIDSVRVRVDIKAKADITPVYSPTHDLKVDRKSPRHVIATYEQKNTLPTTDFLVYYRTADEDVGATLLTHQGRAEDAGYFMLMVSPNMRTAERATVPKDVVVVYDRSGSMSGDKMTQARQAVRHVIKNLNSEDRFNVIAYCDEIEVFFDQLVKSTGDNVGKAGDIVDRLNASGGTNIHGALIKALDLLKAARADNPREKRPAYVIFMTDGIPTIGETDEQKILAAVESANPDTARIFAFGVGYDVNVRLLDRLVRGNRGRSDYVKPKEPIEAKMASLCNKIKNPVMTDLTMNLMGVKTRSLHPQVLADLFEGDQILVTGRYDHADVQSLRRDGNGKAHSTLLIKGFYRGKEEAFEYPVTISPAGRDVRFAFVEQLWAIRRVGYLLDQIQLHGESKEVIDEVIRLSRDYGIITPYTSFLADERTELASGHRLRELAKAGADELMMEFDGAMGQVHAKNRGALNQAVRAPRPTATPGGGEGQGVEQYGFAGKKEYEAGDKKTLSTVRQVGNQTLYRRGKTWMTPAAADQEKEGKQKAIEVKRFSEAYFKLVRANREDENRILASQGEGEELLITLRGQTYRVR